MVQDCINGITTTLEDLLPGFGTEIAIDSTAIRTHSNPDRKSKVTGLSSDPDAQWGVKHSVKSRATDSTEWFYGFKLHLTADANYEIPISFNLTPGNRNDSPELRAVMNQAYDTFSWFQPKTALADRGYDSAKNFQYLFVDHHVDPIVHIRKPTSADGLYEGLFNKEAIPLCMGMEPMEYVGRTSEDKHIFRCRSEGCRLKAGLQSGITHCDTVIEEDPLDNLRVLGGRTRRNTPEWKALYAKRWAIERVFKSLKQGCRLESHHARGLKAITLHALMSLLVYQSRALVKVLAGGLDDMRWQVRKVA